MTNRLKRGIVYCLQIPVLLYRYILSPILPARCRYLPTCSEYALEALEIHGPLKGGLYALRRFGRCHPWGGSGYDPVPPAPDSEAHRSLTQKSSKDKPGSGHRCHHCG